MKKETTRFAEKTKKSGTRQKSLGEKIGPAGKTEQKVLTINSDQAHKKQHLFIGVKK